jgi:spermidine/putrescine transport system permease protein
MVKKYGKSGGNKVAGTGGGDIGANTRGGSDKIAGGANLASTGMGGNAGNGGASATSFGTGGTAPSAGGGTGAGNKKVTLKKYAAKIYLIIILLLLYLPLMWIFVFSFTESVSVGKWTSGFTLKVYATLFNGNYTEQILSALLNTLIIGLSATVLATIIGTLGAIGIFNMKKRSKQIYTNVNRIPLLDAEIITALSLVLLFLLFGIPNGYTTVILAHTAFCIPYVVLNVLPKLKQMNPNTYEAALDLGATPAKAMTKIILPQIRGGIISGAIMAFTLSIDDFVITSYLKQSFDTLSTFIYNTAGGKRPLPPEVRALSSLMFLAVLLLLYFLNRTDKKPLKNKAN